MSFINIKFRTEHQKKEIKMYTLPNTIYNIKTIAKNFVWYILYIMPPLMGNGKGPGGCFPTNKVKQHWSQLSGNPWLPIFILFAHSKLMGWGILWTQLTIYRTLFSLAIVTKACLVTIAGVQEGRKI